MAWDSFMILHCWPTTFKKSNDVVKLLQEIAQKTDRRISFEKTDTKSSDRPIRKQNHRKIEEEEIKIVDKFNYSGEIITYNLN